MAKKIRAGTFNTEIPDEVVLWRDRKRKLFLGLPWSFTTYELTETKLRLGKGFFKKTEDDILLYRITDVSFYQTLGERLAGLGTLCIMSSDVTNPEAHLVHIKKARKVKELLLQKVEEARKRSGVFTSEIVGMTAAKPSHDSEMHEKPAEQVNIPGGVPFNPPPQSGPENAPPPMGNGFVPPETPTEQ